ncbi:unnamed protein product [Somion occarium]|uniref:F-box domain-containing protein n=1 Tax=Somion occarium TaxID=3059160 RepID=A0ABP1CZF8_9APHY
MAEWTPIAPQGSSSPIFPNELVDMFIDHLDDTDTLLTCMLVHRCWAIRARYHLFQDLTIRPLLVDGVKSFYHLPIKARQSSEVHIDVILMQELLLLFPNVENIKLEVTIIGTPDAPHLNFTPDLGQIRQLRYLKLSTIVEILHDSDLLDFFSLFSRIDRLYIEDCSADVITAVDVEHFPEIHALEILDLVTDDFINGLFKGPHQSRFGSVQELAFSIFDHNNDARWETVLGEVGPKLPQLKVLIYDPVSAYLHDVFRVLDPPTLRASFWEMLVDWDCCLALQNLTIHSYVCSSSVGHMIGQAVFAAVIQILCDLRNSRHACTSSETGIEHLTIEFEVDHEFEHFRDLFRGAPWKDLEKVLLDLRQHPRIRLREVTLLLSGIKPWSEYDERLIDQVALRMEKGVEGMGPEGFVEFER